MPIGQYHLHAFGLLPPLICRAMGVKVMTCANCAAEVTLALKRAPLGAEGVRGDLGGLLWGDDVAVICPNCSVRRAAVTP